MCIVAIAWNPAALQLASSLLFMWGFELTCYCLVFSCLGR
jgi:hypothetical protein